MASVMQEWTKNLTLMQQSVLITAVRGADGLEKNHVSKQMNRWLRRSFMKMAFTGKAVLRPDTLGGGSFTGPSINECTSDEARWRNMDHLLDLYLSKVDEIPHHYQLHIMHAAEILGYKHPDDWVRKWWNYCYRRLVNDAHLNVETEEVMDRRLGDNEKSWRSAEEVVAK